MKIIDEKRLYLHFLHLKLKFSKTISFPVFPLTLRHPRDIDFKWCLSCPGLKGDLPILPRRRWIMDLKDLKKILAGLTIAALLAGTTLTVSSCRTTGEKKPGSVTSEEKKKIPGKSA
jgi:radical SAM modification target selenobiotic family peptide